MSSTWIIILGLIFLIPGLYLYLIREEPKEKKTGITEPDYIQLYPDYTRANPYKAKPGEIIDFFVKGYKEEGDTLKEIGLYKAEIIWKHQNYIGKILDYDGNRITYQLPEEQDKRGKTSYISVTYHGMKNASWIKIEDENS